MLPTKTKLSDFIGLTEATGSRYSVDVNYRSKHNEVTKSFAKICLGYVSAAMKKQNYHVKQVYDVDPIRILVGSRAFDDGEWVGVVSYNHNHEGGSFIISKGFYNKDRKTVSIQSSHKANGESAAEITTELLNIMYSLKTEKDGFKEKLKPVPMQRGPNR